MSLRPPWLEQRCTGYEVNGAGGVQLGARLLGSPDAAMAMIGAYDAAIKALDGQAYDTSKFRPEVTEAAGKNLQASAGGLDQEPERGLRRLWRDQRIARPAETVLAFQLRYSITLSAVASSDGGTLMPSAFAPFMLMTRSYLVGICTGRSPGAAPLRMRST